MAIMSEVPELPETICQDCAKKSNTYEVVGTRWPYSDPDNEELWVYCGECNVETFHPIGKNTVDR